jgi:hypothetical protein
MQASVEGYLGALMADPVVARAFQLEGDLIGGKARERRRATAAWFAQERLDTQERLRKTDPQLKRRPLSTHLAAVVGMREVAGEALEASKEPDFASMVDELVDWVVTAWYEEKPPLAAVTAAPLPARKKARRASRATAA